VEDLHGNGPAQEEILGLVNIGHPAASEMTDQAIPI
jgi:hypothetical protein